MTNRIFIDTEFYEFQPTERIYVTESSPEDDVYGAHHITRPKPGANAIQLISLGATKPTGETFYAEFLEFDWGQVPLDHWLQENVRPTMNCTFGFDTEFIRNEFLGWCGDKPEFWGWYADYDWVALCGLYGRMVDLPKGWPMYCRDVKQLADENPGVELPPKPPEAHHALADAIWACEAHKRLTGQA